MRIAKIVAPVIGVLLFAAPAFAQTDDYGTGATSGTYCPQLFQTVVRGSSGNQVLELQKFLSDYYDIAPATIQTGYFGRITQGYVQQFQREQGLPSFGIAGSMTRAAIARICGTKPPVVQSCPQYQIPICSAGQHAENGVTDSNGCIGAPRCVNNAVSCPIYNACPAGYTANTSTDANGCTVRQCVPPTTNSSLRALPASGQAPLTISLQAPQDVMDKMQKCVYSGGWFGASGNGLYVDWGDGRTDPQNSQTQKLSGKSCTSVVQSHTYTAQGTYTIKVGSWHPGPTDAAVTDWEGTTVVSVAGGGSAVSLNLLSPQGGESYQYQEFPLVKWNIVTNKKIALRIELLDQDGNVVSSETQNDVAYTGDGSAQIRPQSFDTYDALLRAGKTRFSVRVSVVDNGQVIAQKRSGDLLMSAQWNNNISGGLQVMPISGVAPLTVTLNYNIWHPSCISYRMDWGDGSSPDTLIQPVQSSCLLDSQNKVFTHTYSKSGTYTAMMKSNNLDPFKSLDSIVMYESATVQVQ